MSSGLMNKMYQLYKRLLYLMKYKNAVIWGQGMRFRYSFKINIKAQGVLKIGRNCFFNAGCSINVHKNVIIGDDCILGEDVKIYDHNHCFNLKGMPVAKQGYSEGCVFVGNNCWIGSNVLLLKGCEIGNDCVIGAGCIISGNIPSGSLVTQKRNLEITDITYKNIVKDEE